MAGRKKKKLDPRRSIFISGILSGKSGAEAAREAGVETKNAARQANRWQNDPAIAEEIEKGLAAIREGAHVDVDTMIRQLDADRQFAIKTENASAATRASELKAKLCGLMIEKRDVRAAVVTDTIEHTPANVAAAITALVQDAGLKVVKSDTPGAEPAAALEPANNPETLHLDAAEQTADSVTETMIADQCPLSGGKRTFSLDPAAMRPLFKTSLNRPITIDGDAEA